jgi:hypothetical protein
MFQADAENAAAVASWIRSQEKPVIVLHHETPSSFHRIATSHIMSRQLATTNITSAPLSEFQISQYQICAWTAIVFFVLLGSAVCSLKNMEVVPDSLLYAKFQSTRAQKND